jgi:hypothetical protein
MEFAKDVFFISTLIAFSGFILSVVGWLLYGLAELWVDRSAQSVQDDILRDAARYRMIRRGQHWSVIDGVGDDLRAEALDEAVDIVLAAAPKPEGAA